MLRLVLFRFWPVLIPLLLYWLWFVRVAKKARREGKPVPRFRDGPWYWLMLSSLLIAVGCMIFWRISIEDEKGAYTPPHLQNGKLIPGQVGKAP